jgi:hypothetical protein
MIDADHSRTWNRFAGRVVALHQQRLSGHDVTVSERVGQYGGEMARGYYFREASYVEAGSNRLLSRVRWDRDDPKIVQIAEVYLYDDAGRVQRDYAFIYLPWGRGAPIRTFINLHEYHDDLHATRQFDASGKTTYESCRGTFEGRAVDISLPEERLGSAVSASPEYQRCFAALPVVADDYLAPR